jgi:hypothetical protein
MGRPVEIYVSPTGSDENTGTKGKPLKTVRKAMKLLRSKRAGGAPKEGRVLLQEGTYYLNSQLKIGRADSGVAPTIEREKWEIDPGWPTVVCSAPGESATLSGGRRITGFKPAEINGIQAVAAKIPAVKSGRWDFHHLWVNGKRAPRTRFPEEGLFRIAGLVDDPARKKDTRVGAGVSPGAGFRKFKFGRGDLKDFANIGDVDFVALHFWVASRIPFKHIDTKKKVAELAFRPTYQLTDDFSKTPTEYYIENVREALKHPGQWYLDRCEGMLYYIPREDEAIESIEVIAPVLPRVVEVSDVSHVHFKDLTFSHTEYTPDAVTREINGQALPWVSAAVSISGSNRCTVQDCTVEHVGTYGISILGDSVDCEIRRCTIQDLGAGGIKVFHAVDKDSNDPGAVARGRGDVTSICRRIVISDNTIRDGGSYYRQAVGVLVGKCSGVQVVHNDIHDFDYTGISVGWTWGYAESRAFGNIIEYNHIYNIGRGALSDMGGIYLLGVAPGTRLRYNHIHDVVSRGYGGWGIYTDEGSTDVLIESNLVYDTSVSGFHQHYGRRNIIQNNIFAYGRKGQIQITRTESEHLGLTFERNIFFADHPAMLMLHKRARDDYDQFATGMRTDRNIYFSTSTKKLDFGGMSWAAWKGLGNESAGMIADPLFADPAERDFSLKPGSPALGLGFVPFDPDRTGRREASNTRGAT